MMIKNICIYCGSSIGNTEIYKQQATLLGVEIANQAKSLVYGGGDIGLMGVIANEVLRREGEVIGIIPQQIVDLEVAHDSLTELIVVDSMAARKTKLIEVSDAFIAMPGGYGTLDELFETLVLFQLNIINKPTGLFNINGYFDPMLTFIDHMVKEGFVRKEHRDSIVVSDDPKELLDRLAGIKQLAVGKWVEDIKEEEK
jgi:uncharacterized protein (TIGR00730 family)